MLYSIVAVIALASSYVVSAAVIVRHTEGVWRWPIGCMIVANGCSYCCTACCLRRPGQYEQVKSKPVVEQFGAADYQRAVPFSYQSTSLQTDV